MMTNNICCYVDTKLKGQMTTWALTNPDIQNTVVVTNIEDASGN